MPAFLVKTKEELLQRAIRRLERFTPITANAPGTVARSIIEIITDELGDFYEILEFNSLMWSFSTARGAALDNLATLFGLKRRSLTSSEIIAAQLGSFYFFIDAPIANDVVIPRGTKVFANADSFVGRQLSFETTADATVTAGQTRIFASLRPLAADGIFSVGKGTLTDHDFETALATVHCDNPKPINAQVELEDDDDYRARISKEIRRIASSNEAAIRFEALRIEGVRDVKIRSYGFGLGTVDVLVVAQDPSIQDDILNRAKDAINVVCAAGITPVVRVPETLSVDVSFGIVIRTNSTLPRNVILNSVRNAIRIYINSLSVNDKLIFNQMLTRALEAHADVVDVIVNNFSVDNRVALKVNYQPGTHQQLIPGDITVDLVT